MSIETDIADPEIKKLLIRFSTILAMALLIMGIYLTYVKMLDISVMEKKVRNEYVEIFNNYTCLPREEGCYIDGSFVKDCSPFDIFGRFNNSNGSV